MHLVACFCNFYIVFNFTNYTYVLNSSTCVYIIAIKSLINAIKIPTSYTSQRIIQEQTLPQRASNLYKISHLNDSKKCNQPLINFKF